MENGVLYPHEQHPPMKCVTCGLDVMLHWKHEPGLENYKGKVAPGTVWGQDVAVICMCCSFDHCKHKGQGKLDEGRRFGREVKAVVLEMTSTSADQTHSIDALVDACLGRIPGLSDWASREGVAMGVKHVLDLGEEASVG